MLHARGRPVLHRDLKPGNVFVGTGQLLKVGDFGMSRYVDLAAAAGAPAVVCGTRLRRRHSCAVSATTRR